MGLGYSLVIPILLGVFFGLALDRWLHTKPIFMLIGIVGGVIASFYTILTSDK